LTCGGCRRGRCEPSATGWPSCGAPARRTARESCAWLASAAEAEQARQQVRADHQTASEQLAALESSWRRRGEHAAAGEHLVLAMHALQTTTSQADQAAERLGVLRRAQQRHLGWMEAHDAELRVQERAVAREGAWRRRVDQRALVLDPPGWLVAELGPVPKDPPERAVWRLAAAELEGYRRAYGLNHPPPAKHGFARVARDGQVAAPAMTPTAERTGGAGERRERRGRGDHTNHRGGLGRRPTVAADQRHQVDPDRLLDGQPRRDTPGRRRDWQVARAALEHLAGWSRHHDHRDHRDQQPPNRDRPGRTLGRDLGHQERNGR
jgi:hypothetical protein